MPYFTEQARTESECREKIRARYGDQTKVVDTRRIRRGGFLGIGGHDEVEMTGIYGYVSPDWETAKRQVLAAAGKTPPDAALQGVIREINSLGDAVRGLSEKVDAKMAPPETPRSDHPSLSRLEEDLYGNDFSPAFVRPLLDRARAEFRLNDLEDYDEVQKQVIHWIGERIAVYREPELPLLQEGAASEKKKRPRTIILVGPTGVGKTTTITKLAALYGESSLMRRVRLVTLDYYRIGAMEQIEKYASIMELPVNVVYSHEDLRKILNLYRQDTDFVLVDTAGNSPRNYEELGKLKAMLEACPSRFSETHLCISASTKSGDIKDILKQFGPFNYKAVIVTKLDETARPGNVISALAEEGKCVSFITTGQTVPTDIERASVIRFLEKLEGFTVDRNALIDYFRTKDRGV